MSAFTRFLSRIFGRPAAPPARGRADATRLARGGPAASFDAAKTGAENRNHWANADGLSAPAAHSPEVRATLRNRSRYECANNGYAGGVVRGRADATIGVCPRLQLTLPESWVDPETGAARATPEGAARAVELLWNDWCDETGYADKLRCLDRSETREGEAFGVFVTNEALAHVTLDLRNVEADQIATPFFDPLQPNAVDGIEFDRFGNPAFYHLLKSHPGDAAAWGGVFGEFERVPAAEVVHLFDLDRAGQRRGVPALTSALPLYAYLRRYTLATLGAAEVAAMIAGVIESDLPPDAGGAEAPEIVAMDEIPFARNGLMTMPAGQKAKAFPPAQPVPSYRDFKGEVLTEAGRAVDAPRNVSTGSSAEYNYSSGRLDHLPQQQAYKVRRDRWRRLVLDRTFRLWGREASVRANFLPAGLPPPSLWRWKWRWDGFGSIDPVKDVTANQIALEGGQTTLERVAAEHGDDWEEVLQQQAREMALRKKLGLPQPGQAAADADAADDGDDPDGGGGDDGRAGRSAGRLIGHLNGRGRHP